MPKGVYKHEKGRVVPEVVRRKISSSRAGYRLSQTTREKIGKSPHVVGEAHGKAKLTEATVIEIRELYSKGLASQTALANKYSISQGCVWSILVRRTWKHI